MWGWFFKKPEEPSKQKVYCPDCDAKTKQVPLPTNDEKSSKGKECGPIYEVVAECMKTNKGQVTACTKEWDAFKNCHAKAAG